MTCSVYYKNGSGCCAQNELQRSKRRSRDIREEPCIVTQVRDGGGWHKEFIVEMPKADSVRLCFGGRADSSHEWIDCRKQETGKNQR